MPGHYGDKKKAGSRPERKKAGSRPEVKKGAKARTGSFPKPPQSKPRRPEPPRTPVPRTGSFPIPKSKPAGAKAMKAATLALLKKKKKK